MQVGLVKIALFEESRSIRLRRYTAENLCLSATVAHVHDGAMAEEYAVSSTTLVMVDVDNNYGSVDFNNVCCRRNLFITRTAHILCDTEHRVLAVR